MGDGVGDGVHFVVFYVGGFMSFVVDVCMVVHFGIGIYVSNVFLWLVGFYCGCVSVIGDSEIFVCLLWICWDNIVIVDCCSFIFLLCE